MKKIYYLCVCILLYCSFSSCKKDKDYIHTPPTLRLDSLYTEYLGPVVSSYQSYSFPGDTLVTDITVDYSGTKLKLFYEVSSEANLEQLDVQLFGISGAKFIRDSPADTILLNGNGSLQWPNNSIRSGFKTKNSDKFQILIPSLQQASSIVVMATDEEGYQHAYTIELNHR
jgi:hypothetical protein